MKNRSSALAKHPYQKTVLVLGVDLDLVALAVVDADVAARAALDLPAQVVEDLLATLQLRLAALNVADDLFPVYGKGKRPAGFKEME